MVKCPFVEYHNRPDAERAVKYLNGTKLDDREVRMDFDWGFQEGRQFGRGKSGGQVRDEYRTTYDEGRGGYGKLLKTELDALQNEDEEEGAPSEGHRGERRAAAADADAAAPNEDDGRAPMVVAYKYVILNNYDPNKQFSHTFLNLESYSLVYNLLKEASDTLHHRLTNDRLQEASHQRVSCK